MPAVPQQGGQGTPEPDQQPTPRGDSPFEFGDLSRIIRRAANIPLRMANEMPAFSTHMVFSSIPDEIHDQVMQTVPRAMDYLGARDSFAGIPGVFSAARMTALDTTDPAVRQTTLAVIDHLQTFSPGDQAAAYAILSGNTAGFNADVLNRVGGQLEEAIPGLDVSQAQDISSFQGADQLEGVTSGDQSVQGGIIQPTVSLENSNEAVSSAVALRLLFPDLQDRFSGAIEDKSFDTAITNISEHLSDTFYNLPAGIGRGFVDPFLDLHDDPSLTNLLTLPLKEVMHGAFTFGLKKGGSFALASEANPLTAYRFPGKLVSAPFGLTVGAAQGLFRASPLNDLSLTNRLADSLGEATRTGEGMLHKVLKPQADFITTKIGFKPGTPAHETVSGLFEAVLGVTELHGVTKAAGDVKLARSAPLDVYKAKTGIDLPLSEQIAANSRSILGSPALGTAVEVGTHPLRYSLDRPIAELTGKLFGKETGEWVTTRPGKQFFRDVDSVIKANPKSPVAALVNRYGGRVPVDLARELAETPAELRPMKLADYVDSVVDSETVASLQFQYTVNKVSIANLEAKIASLKGREAVRDEATTAGPGRSLVDYSDEEIARTTALIREESEYQAARQRYDELVAEQASIQSTLATDIGIKEPIYRFPRRNVIRAGILEPTTRLERLIYTTNEAGRRVGADLRKTVDELPRYPRLWNKFSADAPLDADSVNLDTWSKWARRAKVPDSIAKELGEKLVNVKDDVALFDWVIEASEAVKRSLPKDTPTDLVNQMTRWLDKGVEGRRPSLIHTDAVGPDGTVHRVAEPVVPQMVGDSGLPRALPSRPSEFLDHIGLPDVDLVVEATGALRRMMRNLKNSGKLGYLGAEGSYYLPKFVGELATATLKAPILGLRVVAVALRTQGEQAVRASQLGYRPFKIAPKGFALFPGGVPVPFTGARLFSRLFGERGVEILGADPRFEGFGKPGSPGGPDLGSIANNMLDTAREYNTEVRTAGMKTFSAEVMAGAVRNLEMAASDEFTREFVRLGFDRPAILEWFKQHPKAVNDLRNLTSILRQSELNKGEYADTTVTISGKRAVEIAQFPHRTLLPPREGGSAGEATILFNPETQRAILTEGHHRAGVAARAGADMEFQIKIVDADTIRGDGLGQPAKYLDNQHPVVRAVNAARESGKSDGDLVLEWLDRTEQNIDEITGGDPDLKHFIATGRWNTRAGSGRRMAGSSWDGRDWEGEYELNTTAYKSVRDSIKRAAAENDLPLLRTLQAARKGYLERMKAIEREHGIGPSDTAESKIIDLGDRRKMTRALKKKYEEGEIRPPETVMVARGKIDVFRNEGFREGMLQSANDWSNAWYSTLRVLSKADMKLTRGSLFYQIAEQSERVLRSRGFDEATAKAWSQVEAAKQVRDIMYDLSSRTSLQRSLKDIFWFAPATQEILYTWFVKIPSESYLPIGLAGLAGKATLIHDALVDLGVIQKGPRGEDVVMVPGFSKLLGQVPGLDLEDITYFRAKGLNLVASSPFPGLATLPSYVTGHWLTPKFGGNPVYKMLADQLMPYGLETTFLPQPIIYAYEALTGKAPWDPFSPGKVKADYDRAYDIAIQNQYADLLKQGVKPPLPEQFQGSDGKLDEAEEDKFRAAQKVYLDRLMGGAKEYLRGAALGKLLGSTVAPSALSFTSEERRDWEQFLDTVFGDDNSGLTDEARDQMDQYLKDHPNSFAYSVFYSRYDDPTRTLPYQSTGDQAAFDMYYTGQKRVLTPEEYADKLAAMESYRHYTAQLNQALVDIAGEDLDPVKLLTHGFERQAALTDFKAHWSRYLGLNDKAAGSLRDASIAWANAHNQPVRTWEVERLADTITALSQLSGFFTGETGLRTDEYRAIVGQLKSLYSETGQFGEPTTKTEKAMDWYWENILGPYFDAREPLQQRANKLDSAGLDASGEYEAIRQLNAKYEAMARQHGGVKFPTPEEVIFGNRNPDEKDAAVWNWATKPPSWLTDFQRGKVGYESFNGDDDFYTSVNKFEDAFRKYLDDNDIAPGSDLYDRYQRYHDSHLLELAEPYGPNAVQAITAQMAPPFVRLSTTGFGQGNSSWAQVSAWASDINQRLEQDAVSAKGFSQEALFYKTWFYTQVVALKDSDPDFERLLTELSYAIPAKGYVQRQGVPLFEAVFFNNWNPAFIPESLAKVGY